MAEMKSIQFPGSSEVYEIVDAAARSGVAGLQARMNGLIDDTLSESGSAADAKATGEAIETVGEVAQGAAEAAETSANTFKQLLPTTTGTGARVTLEDDTIAAPLAGLIIYGKSVQAAAPSRTSPADIATAGNGGVIAIVTKDGSGNAKSGADIPLNATAGLPGIAVPATGTWNHRDGDGTCWLCDVVNFNTGIYTRRIGLTTFRDLLGVRYMGDGVFKTTSPALTSTFTNYIMTRIYESVDNDYYPPTLQDGQICPINTGAAVQWKDSRFDSVEALMAAIGDEPILYKLRTNSSVRLTDRQLAAFRSLASAEGTTVVYADDPVEPEISVKAYKGLGEYVASVNALKAYVRDMSPVAAIGPADMVSVDDAAPLTAEELAVNVEPVQAGSGDPSPTNVRPISGWDGVTVTDAGKNLLNRDIAYYYNDNLYFGRRSQGNIPDGTFILNAGTYTISSSSNMAAIYTFDESGTPMGLVYNNTKVTITNPKKQAVLIRFYKINATEQDFENISVQLEFGSTPTAYEPYKSRTASVDFGQTVYGGTVDLVTGVCVVDKKIYNAADIEWRAATASSSESHRVWRTETELIDRASSSTWLMCSKYKPVSGYTANNMPEGSIMLNEANKHVYICDTQFATLEDFEGSLDDCQFVTELANPVTLAHLTSAQLELFKGANNISADAGQVTVTYRQDVFLALNKRINELQALVLES